MSKLFDKLRNAARARGRPDASALLSHALRRAADERAALRAVSPAGAVNMIDVDAVEVARIQEDVEVQERLAAAKARAEANVVALEAARQRADAADLERRRLKRLLVLAVCALMVTGAIIAARTFMPGGAFGEHTAPLFRLDRELKTAPDTAKK